MKKRKKLLSLVLAVAIALSVIPTTVFASTTDKVEERDLVQYVDPLIGSDNFTGNSEFAGLVPYVTAPFGMTNFTPQTRENKISDISYIAGDKKITGFFATHQPAIWMGDYGYFNVMPQPGDTIKPSTSGRGLTFSHDDEVSTPYYYSVTMDKENSGIQGEITATERCAIYRFTFPQGGKNSILIESARGRGNSDITIDVENNEVYGWNNDHMTANHSNTPPKNLKGYFSIQFDKPFEAKGTYENYQVTADSTDAGGQKAGAYLTFDTEPGEVIELRIGTSFLSEEQARANIQQEIGDKSFEEVSEDLKEVWNDKLNTIQIDGATYDENCIFYTAMFHSSIYPRKFYEVVDGVDTYYSPYDDQVHQGKSYTDFSLWDTFRAENSFLTLVYPELIDEMVTSLLQNYQEGGYMPKWPNPYYTNTMIGTHADSVVAEAIQKGLLDESKYELAYEAVYKDAMYQQDGEGDYNWTSDRNPVPYEARGGLGAYKLLGYIPNNWVTENVSRTMEFAYDDWCVAQVAKATGRETEYEFFLNRSLNYKNVIDPNTGYANGRDMDGNWDSSGSHMYTEGNSKNYTWFALHDPQGLIDYMTEHKGEDFYNTELEKAWTQGWLRQDNEPCHHYGYMFDFSGRPDLTQKYVRQTLLKSYSNDHAGMLGNDDCGQMSAWYIWSSMGFYPVNPASGEYMIGSPMFDKVTINNPLTKEQFVVTAQNNDDPENANMYIQSATLNGEEHNIPVLTHEQITQGGNIDFVMGDTPSTWGSQYRKEAIVGNPDVTIEDPKPAFLGNSTVTRIQNQEENVASNSQVSVPGDFKTGSGLGDPKVTLIDGNKSNGYLSSGVSQSTLDSSPFYITFQWDQPQNVGRVVVTGNYPKSQGMQTVDIEVSTNGEDWNKVVTDYAIPWETDQEAAESQTIQLPQAQQDIVGLRIQVKKAAFRWGNMAIREIEMYGSEQSEDIDRNNPQDATFKIQYRGNKLTGITLGEKELQEGQDYVIDQDDNTILKVKKEVFADMPTNPNTPILFAFSAGTPAKLYLNITEEGAVSAWYEPINVGAQITQAQAPDGWSNNGKDTGFPLTMFDGRLDMGYASVSNPTYPHNIDMTWDEPHSFNQIALYSNYAHEQAPTNVSILVSDDGVTNWTPVMENIKLTWEQNGNSALPPVVIDLPQRVVDKKGVRLQINNATTKWGSICIREIEIYDDQATIVKQKAEDILIHVVADSTALDTVQLDQNTLVKDQDYTVGENTITLKAGYLGNLEKGEYELILSFQNGKSVTLPLVMEDIPQATITATVEPGEDGAIGLISPSGESTVNVGGDRVFILRPGTGNNQDDRYVVDSITVNGVEQPIVSTSKRFALSNVQEDTQVIVKFRERKDFIIQTSVEPVLGGTITPSGTDGNVTVQEGESQTFTFTPSEGYVLDRVEVDGQNVDVTDNTYTIDSVLKDSSVKAYFKLKESSSISTDKDTYQVNETITVTVRTDGQTSGIRLRNERGNDLGLTKVKSVYQDGQKIWTIQTSLGTKGNRTIQVLGCKGGQWNPLGDFSIAVEAIEVPKSKIYEAVIQEEQAAVNQPFTVLVRTSKDAQGVAVHNENGRYVSSRVEGYEDQGDQRIFTISMEVGTAGTRIFSFYALNSQKELSEYSVQSSVIVTE